MSKFSLTSCLDQNYSFSATILTNELLAYEEKMRSHLLKTQGFLTNFVTTCMIQIQRCSYKFDQLHSLVLYIIIIINHQTRYIKFVVVKLDKKLVRIFIFVLHLVFDILKHSKHDVKNSV